MTIKALNLLTLKCLSYLLECTLGRPNRLVFWYFDICYKLVFYDWNTSKLRFLHIFRFNFIRNEFWDKNLIWDFVKLYTNFKIWLEMRERVALLGDLYSLLKTAKKFKNI